MRGAARDSGTLLQKYKSFNSVLNILHKNIEKPLLNFLKNSLELGGLLRNGLWLWVRKLSEVECTEQGNAIPRLSHLLMPLRFSRLLKGES